MKRKVPNTEFNISSTLTILQRWTRNELVIGSDSWSEGSLLQEENLTWGPQGGCREFTSIRDEGQQGCCVRFPNTNHYLFGNHQVIQRVHIGYGSLITVKLSVVSAIFETGIWRCPRDYAMAHIKVLAFQKLKKLPHFLHEWLLEKTAHLQFPTLTWTQPSPPPNDWCLGYRVAGTSVLKLGIIGEALRGWLSGKSKLSHPLARFLT